MKAVILVLYAFRDLFIRYLPQMRKKGGFAFLVHPRNIPDVYRKYPLAKYLPEKLLLWGLRHFWPVVLSEVEEMKNESGKQIRGWIIMIPLTAKQMLDDRNLAKKKIFQAIRHCTPPNAAYKYSVTKKCQRESEFI